MDKLHRYARNFIKTHFDGLKVKQSNENSYEYKKDIIRLNLRDDDDFGFLRHLRETHGCQKLNDKLMLWTILHEVGHYMTQDDITEEEYAVDMATKAICAVISKETAELKNVQNMYFDAPSEWHATEWAVEWVEDNYEEASKIAKELESLR